MASEEQDTQPPAECTKSTPWFSTSFKNLLSVLVIVGAGYIWQTNKDAESRTFAASIVTWVLGWHFGKRTP